ncbi:limonene-1,2-epoxide hydrolase family protein [Rhizobium lusitanum]|uniref:limonene-1,2-epoxide hydrolase family protein n=1 Tax=Rhizobium lusitanum TaxID=293958 RepID=UPI001956379D|nr:limonene-1,2-epoxide hydrolase family protein [Rhizobium lusitanum]MBM7046226.1 nuclear transport factor 2 family protein [Rhizobium lusitanum]
MPSNIDTVRDFIALWNVGDPDAILAMMAPDCIYHNMPWDPLVGHAAIRQGLATFMRNASEIDWRVYHIAQGGNGVVMTERLDRFLIKGKWWEFPVMGIFELQDGRITHWRDYFDSVQVQAARATVA